MNQYVSSEFVSEDEVKSPLDNIYNSRRNFHSENLLASRESPSLILPLTKI